MTTSISRNAFHLDDIQTGPSVSVDRLNNKHTPPESSGVLQNQADLIFYPEGGFAAWIVVFGAFCGLCGGVGTMNTMGAFQRHISQYQLHDYTDGDIGWIFGIYAFLSYACGLIVGPLFDQYNARYLIATGGAGVSAAMFLAGSCQTYWHFMLVFGVLNGISTSLLFVPCFTVIGHWFNVRRGFATGIAALGGAVGGIIYPIVLQALIPHAGWAVATRALGFILLFLCSTSALLVRKRLPPLNNASAKLDFRILRNPTYAVAIAAVFMIECALFIPLTYMSSYATYMGFNDAFGSQLLIAINASSIFGRIIPGFFSDKVGRFNTMICITSIMAISVLGIWLPVGNTKGGILAFALIFGFASGSGINLVPVCIGQLCRTEDYGRYYATCNAIVSIGLLLGIPIAGEIIKSNGGAYWGLIIFVGMCYVGGLPLLASARIMSAGPKVNVIF
ncbi:related to monocarboxylate transporter 2 [Phialocephala subalpina]|uniref:Related to monocarboxylate transporter 2 n=1 Tax=Phialocephala subalpina TaxID=576137 RepID=A0A1L7XNY6_9HELO|nr:related to monocarboxylate transporter 2 [Phialocephala subalpina]